MAKLGEILSRMTVLFFLNFQPSNCLYSFKAASKLVQAYKLPVAEPGRSLSGLRSRWNDWIQPQMTQKYALAASFWQTNRAIHFYRIQLGPLCSEALHQLAAPGMCPVLKIPGHLDDPRTFVSWTIDPAYYMYEACTCSSVSGQHIGPWLP
eukprot:1158510-Pelagomonas_calceolata.AAC.7